MPVWIFISVAAMIGLIILAHRSEGGETLGVKQAFYVGAFCAFLFACYNTYQWKSIQLAPAEVEEYIPLYPNSRLTTRVPVRQLTAIREVFTAQETEDSLKGQWIFVTEDSTDEVGRYYRRWSHRTTDRVGVQMKQAYSEVLIDAPNHSMNVLAENHWGKTRITYTLMSSLH